MLQKCSVLRPGSQFFVGTRDARKRRSSAELPTGELLAVELLSKEAGEFDFAYRLTYSAAGRLSNSHRPNGHRLGGTRD